MTVSVTEPEHAPHATFKAPDLHEVAGLFPNYDVYGLIACGGMGAVYHANQRSLDREVAIKILPREFSQDKEFRISFEAEAKSMAKLNHPNLIGVYDFGDVTGLLYIVMEYVPGSSLYSVSTGRVVHQDDALKMVIDVLRGLAHAHQYGILHRDIKPSNILMDANANPKIGDFGLASVLGKQIEEGEQIFGTPGYTAPEVIEPPHAFDHRADIFSVGIMLHEMLTGVTPDGVQPLAALPPTTNPKLRTIIQRAIHPNPDARHASAEELVADLEKIGAFTNNPLLTGPATKRVARHGALSKSALSSGSGVARPGVLQTSTSSTGSRVARPLPRHRSLHKSTSSSGSGTGTGFLILLVIAAIALIYFFIIKPSATATDVVPEVQNAPKPAVPPVAQKPAPRKTVAQEGVKPMDDVDAFFVRAEGIIKDRLKEDLDTYREGLKTPAENFETQARQSISTAGPTAVADLASTMQKWRSQNYLMSDFLPGSLSSVSSIQGAFTNSHAAQAKVRSRFNQRLASEKSIYIKGLKKQIENYRASKDFVAISLLEKEIARVNSEPRYYEFLIGL